MMQAGLFSAEFDHDGARSYPGGRYDVHRPSVIDPADYDFVGHECMKVEGLGDALFLADERRAIQEHMKRTGGTYSRHEHGGNCGVCGSVHAIYTILFYHRPSNTYVRMGQDCAGKCEMGDHGADLFRARVADARLAVAGKRKAAALLAEAGVSGAWELYAAPGFPGCLCGAPCDCYRTWERARGWRREESTIIDIVAAVVKFGDLSDKRAAFLVTLLERIGQRAGRDAADAAAREAAADCPTGRLRIRGEVLSVRVDEGGEWGAVTKCLVRSDEGYKVWGTRPSGTNVERGDRLEFTATVTASKDDVKFGFYKRPAAAVVLERKGTV